MTPGATRTQPLKEHMTQDTLPPEQPKPRVMCDSCAGIQRNWRKAPGHPELVQGESHADKRRTGFVTITKYRCDRCGTSWLYENDKANQKAGWSVGR
ncbi:MAG: hypothetical protein JWQ72_1698 [Polaromonas sp.]|nr:hypothetical protein [Polaromonas sp.]